MVIDVLMRRRRERAMNNLLHIENSAAWENQVHTILLVEDEAFVRNVTREILEAVGYRVLTAGDSVTALSLYDECGAEVDLLLTDMILPGEDGSELAAKIRRQNPRPRVLFVTGYADPIAVLKNSSEEYLLKPFGSEALLRKVAELMEATMTQPAQQEPLMRACVGA